VNRLEIAPEATRYAGLWRRLCAATIDVTLAWIVFSAAISILDPNAPNADATTRETVIALGITLGVLILWFNYFVVAEWRWGQTLGKRALGIRVAGEPGSRVSWGRAVVRNLLLVVDVIAGLFLIPLSARRQRLGDRLAHTVVLMKAGDATKMVPPGGSSPPPGAPPAPSEHPGPGATWGPGRVGLGILALLILSVIEVAIVSIFDPGLDTLAARLVAQALLAVTLVGIVLAVASDRRGGMIPAWTLGLRKPLTSPYALAVGAYIAYIAFALVWSSLIHPHQRDITRDLGVGHGDIGTVVAGFLIVVVAPISEEIFFRGFIFGGFRRSLGFVGAALASAAIFGIFHYTGASSLGVVPQLAFLGFALCFVYERTGSIYPTIAMHMLNNAFAFAVLVS
jgi:membrane protease YdiL (CAAX protease family)